MQLVKVDELPARKHNRIADKKNIGFYLQIFLESGYKYARVDFNHTEYRTVDSLHSSLSNHIKRFNIGNVRVTGINGEVYLIRTDK